VVTTPTILILGAGASRSYGFPSARELRDIICEEFASESSLAVQLLADHYFPHQFTEFCEALRRSGQSSVDAFLERNPDYIPVGKMALAHCLIGYEREDDLFPLKGEQHLYEYILARLGADMKNFPANKLSILTFNYDRSLEHYLETALFHSNRTTISRESVWQTMSSISIVHLYGQLAPLAWQASDYIRRYEPTITAQSVAKAAKFIKIISDKADQDLHKDPEFLQAWQLIDAAKQICFLGFGYNSTNLTRLKIDNLKGRWRIYGTALGLEPSEKKQVADTLGNITLDSSDSLKLLRHYGILC
jgi:hypothetical protein